MGPLCIVCGTEHQGLPAADDTETKAHIAALVEHGRHGAEQLEMLAARLEAVEAQGAAFAKRLAELEDLALGAPPTGAPEAASQAAELQAKGTPVSTADLAAAAGVPTDTAPADAPPAEPPPAPEAKASPKASKAKG